MEIFVTSFIKLTTIFFGGGFVTLLAVWVAQEMSTLARSVLISRNIKNDKDKIMLSNYEKISSHSGLYDIFVSDNKPIELFSSHKGMKLIK